MSISGTKYLKHDLRDNNNDIFLVAISDCHIGSDFDEQALRNTLNFVREHPHAYLLFNGDLINVGLPDSVDDDWAMQEPLSPQDQLDLFVHIFQDYDITKKVVGVVGGSNHHQRARKRFMHDYDLELCQRLGLEAFYAPDGLMLKLDTGYDNHACQTVSYFVYATHGWSAGRKPGAPINASLDLSLTYPLTDLFILSHCHLQSCHVDNYAIPSIQSNEILARERHYVTSGSFLKWGGYAKRKGMRMLGTGCPLIRLGGSIKKVTVEL